MGRDYEPLGGGAATLEVGDGEVANPVSDSDVSSPKLSTKNLRPILIHGGFLMLSVLAFLTPRVRTAEQGSQTVLHALVPSLSPPNLKTIKFKVIRLMAWEV